MTTHTYDAFDRLESVTDRFGEKLVYTYDANGNRATLTDPDNKVTRYTYDALNRIIVGDRRGRGRHQLRILPRQPPEAGHLSERHRRLLHLRRGGPRGDPGQPAEPDSAQPLSAFAYTYDKNGNRTRQVETRGPSSRPPIYDYDDADRLTRGHLSGQEGDLHLRRRGQPPDREHPRGRERSSRDEDLHLRRPRPPAVGDGRGQTPSLEHHLRPTTSTATRPAASVAGSTTDLRLQRAQPARLRESREGRRRASSATTTAACGSRKQAGGQLLRYVYDDDSVLLQTDPLGNTIAKYDYGPDRLLSMSHATQGRQFYLFDSLGSVTDLTGLDGTLKASYQYDAWGNLRAQTGASFNVFGFTGHERDDETGLYYFKARFYDPELGLFLSEDPFAGEVNTPPSLHRYLYAYANPTVYVDLDGRITFLKQWKEKLDTAQEAESSVDDATKDVLEIGVSIGLLRAGADVLGAFNATANLFALPTDTKAGQEARAELDQTVAKIEQAARAGAKRVVEDFDATIENYSRNSRSHRSRFRGKGSTGC